MKGLEYKALEKLCEIATYKGGNDIEIRVSNYNSVIFKALKELYERREMMARLNEACEPHIIEDEAYKKARAFDILKKTISTDLHFNYEEDTKHWSVWIDCEGYQVYVFEGQGKENYDLLKEVLTDGK